jgi:lysophospholipid acyltransferase (LPLAT)-like uncharacterized protein
MHRGRGVNLLISTSNDGQIIASICERFGYGLVRGTASSIREGGRAVIKMIRLLKSGKNVAITPDGPKGPLHKVKPGLIYMAQKTSCPILPSTCVVKKKKTLNSWDRFVLPLPFNKGLVLYGNPIYIGKDDDIDESALKVERAMKELTDRAEILLEQN